MSNVLNRKVAPNFIEIEKVKVMVPEKRTLKNGLPVFMINAGSQEVVKVELLFDAGRYYQSKKLVAYATNSMLDEGTSKMTSAEIAEKIDYYGAFLEGEAGNDRSNLAVYSLNKHLDEVLPVIEAIVKDPVFPQDELITFSGNEKQHLLVNNEKVGHVAKQRFNSLLFGESHPYGTYALPDDFDKIKRDELCDFRKDRYTSDHCVMVVSGKVNDKTFALIEKYFGDNDWKSSVVKGTDTPQALAQSEKKHFVEKKGALQSAIRIGKELVNRAHPDYPELSVLNMLLGGYFGSRLMANIREDKGYTYGIGSGVTSYLHAGVFSISTEVGAEVCNDALKEIYAEIEGLRQNLVPAKELETVKNYMLGTFLKSIDGPFALADKQIALLGYGLDHSYFDRYIDVVKHVSSSRLRDLAAKYFAKDSFYELVVGRQ